MHDRRRQERKVLLFAVPTTALEVTELLTWDLSNHCSSQMVWGKKMLRCRSSQFHRNGSTPSLLKEPCYGLTLVKCHKWFLLTLLCQSWAEERKKFNNRFMGWDKDREKTLQGQKGLNLNVQSEFITERYREVQWQVAKLFSSLNPSLHPSHQQHRETGHDGLVSYHQDFLLLLWERSTFPVRPWGPSHRRQFSMNFSNMGPLLTRSSHTAPAANMTPYHRQTVLPKLLRHGSLLP